MEFLSPETRKTTVHIGNFGTTFILNVPVSAIYSKCLKTSNFTLSDVDWNVRICERKSSAGKSELDVYLDAGITNPTWSSEAEAKFKLYYQGRKDYYEPRYISSQKFSNASRSYGIIGYFPSSKVLDNFVTDGKLRFEIEITTKPLQIAAVKEMERIGGKVRAVIKHVSQLANVSGPIAQSTHVAIRGIRFKIETRKENNTFAAFLNANEEDLSYDWFTNVTVKFKVMPYNTHNPNDKPVEVQLRRTFRKNLSSYGVGLISWDNFVNLRSIYVINDTAVMLIEIEADVKEPIWGADAKQMQANEFFFN